MANGLGYVLPAAVIGIGSVKFRPRRGFFAFNDEGEALAPIIAQAVIEEVHDDELVITEHPIEQGAAISDHSYKRPAEVVISCGWSNSPSNPGGIIGLAVGVAAAVGGRAGQAIGILSQLPGTIQAAQSILSGNSQDQVRAIYAELLALQTSRIPFDVLTGKRAYRSMMFKRLRTVTSAATENALILVAHCQEVLIVSTRIVSVSPSAQRFPGITNPPQDFGPQNLISPKTFTDPGIPGLSGKFQ